MVLKNTCRKMHREPSFLRSDIGNRYEQPILTPIDPISVTNLVELMLELNFSTVLAKYSKEAAVALDAVAYVN